MRQPKQTDPQFKLRLTPELDAAIEAAAAKSGRKKNGEILMRLERSFAIEASEAERRERWARGEPVEEPPAPTSPDDYGQTVLEKLERLEHLIDQLGPQESRRDVLEGLAAYYLERLDMISREAAPEDELRLRDELRDTMRTLADAVSTEWPPEQRMRFRNQVEHKMAEAVFYASDEGQELLRERDRQESQGLLTRRPSQRGPAAAKPQRKPRKDSGR